MNIQNGAKWYMLELAIEDCTAITDVIAYIRNKMPHLNEDSLLDTGISVIKNLLQEGLVDLYYDTLNDPNNKKTKISKYEKRNAVKISIDQSYKLIRDRTIWTPNAWKNLGFDEWITLTIGATEHGRCVYYEGGHDFRKRD